MKKQKDIFKQKFMSGAHFLARSFMINGKSYKDNLSLAMKVSHLKNWKPVSRFEDKKFLNINDLNWVKNNVPSQWVKLSNIEDYRRTSQYSISIYPYSKKKIEISQYLSADNAAIGVMIESEIKSGRKLNLD